MTQPTVAVTGTAERKVDPDEYVLGARIEVVAATSEQAYERLAARAAEVDAALDAYDVRRERESLSAWQDKRQWRAYRSLLVHGRDFDHVADVAGALGRVTDVSVHGPSWRVDDDNPAYDELQSEAVHAARARAQRYAAALDGRLGGLVELSDTDVRGGWGIQRGAAVPLAGSPGGPGGAPGLEALDLAPEPVKLRANVQARWYLDLPT